MQEEGGGLLGRGDFSFLKQSVFNKRFINPKTQRKFSASRLHIVLTKKLRFLALKPVFTAYRPLSPPVLVLFSAAQVLLQTVIVLAQAVIVLAQAVKVLAQPVIVLAQAVKALAQAVIVLAQPVNELLQAGKPLLQTQSYSVRNSIRSLRLWRDRTRCRIHHLGSNERASNTAGR